MTPAAVARRLRPLLLLGFCAAAAAAREPEIWRAPDGGMLPFTTHEAALEFLREAEVVERHELSQGINRPLRVLLRRDGVEARAVFRTVDVRKPRHAVGGDVYLEFHDGYVYECAAYEVSRLLAIDHVPPCVVRKLGRRRGTLQLWIEDAITEEQRRRQKTTAPVPVDWARQQQTLRLFDALIHNFDRNQGNMIIDPSWKLWFIDHTRSFHKSDRVEGLERIVWCEREVWKRLRDLDPAVVEQRLAGLIEVGRVAYLLKRREALVDHLERRIAELGEDVVLFDAGSHATAKLEDLPGGMDAAAATDDIPARGTDATDEEGAGAFTPPARLNPPATRMPPPASPPPPGSPPRSLPRGIPGGPSAPGSATS